jgi:sugar phosphate isomerase/epimerase
MNSRPTSYPISAMLTSLPLDFEAACRQAAALGFSHVDIVALEERPARHREALADYGLLVSCAAVGRGLPENQSLDAASVDARRAAVETVKRQIADAAALGATHCYLVPGLDAGPASLERFADASGLLGEFARQRRVQLCLEHSPAKALPSVGAALAWLGRPLCEHLELLLDVGHCLISHEDPSVAITQAGGRLGYIHLDDNDGIQDLHGPLLSGQLTVKMLEDILASLRAYGYSGSLALELNPKNAAPLDALREGKRLIEQLQEPAQAGRRADDHVVETGDTDH